MHATYPAYKICLDLYWRIKITESLGNSKHLQLLFPFSVQNIILSPLISHTLILSFPLCLIHQVPNTFHCLITRKLWWVWASSYEVPQSYSDTPHSEGLLWTSDQPVAETSTWQHTKLTRGRHPCFRWDSIPQSQQASGRRRSRP